MNYIFQPVRFKLNRAGNPGKPATTSDRDYSVWLGELSPDVDDYQLYKTFACRYQSIRTAKGKNCINTIIANVPYIYIIL